MDYRFSIQFMTPDGWDEPIYCKYPCDVYIEVKVDYSEDYAMELLAWCEKAKPGLKYHDDNVIICAL